MCSGTAWVTGLCRSAPFRSTSTQVPGIGAGVAESVLQRGMEARRRSCRRMRVRTPGKVREFTVELGFGTENAGLFATTSPRIAATDWRGNPSARARCPDVGRRRRGPGRGGPAARSGARGAAGAATWGWRPPSQRPREGAAIQAGPRGVEVVQVVQVGPIPPGPEFLRNYADLHGLVQVVQANSTFPSVQGESTH